MSIKPYTNPDEQRIPTVAAEPTVQEMIAKRNHSFSKAMETSMTLDELDRHLTEIIHRHYHAEA